MQEAPTQNERHNMKTRDAAQARYIAEMNNTLARVEWMTFEDEPTRVDHVARLNNAEMVEALKVASLGAVQALDAVVLS